MNWSKLLFLIGLVLCLPLRIFLIFTNINPETGFYLSGGFWVSLYTTILVICLLGIVGYGLFRMRPVPLELKNPKLLSVASLLIGCLVLVHSASVFWNFVQDLFPWRDFSYFLSGNLVSSLMELLRLLIGLAAAASFFSFAISYIGGRSSQKTAALLTPALWTMLYCGEQFMDYPQIADMSDRVLWFLTIALFTMMLIGQGRVVRNVQPQKGARYISAFGYSCALCGALLGFSQLITLQRASTLPTPQWGMAFCFGIYAFLLAQNTRIDAE